MSAPTGGLGRGLAAILTGPVPTGPSESLRARFVDSAFSSLVAVSALSICGYVHDADGDTEVTLRSPELRSLHPTQAYELFTQARDLVAGSTGRHAFMLGEVPGTGVLTAGATGTSLFFFGDDNLDDILIDRLAAFCEVYTPVLHDHDRPGTDQERVHLLLDQDGGTVHAEVTVNGTVGFGSAAKTHHAAAHATVGAIWPHAKLVDVGLVNGPQQSAAFVVVAGENGSIAMGAAPVQAGPDAAAALAALRAARALAADKR